MQQAGELYLDYRRLYQFLLRCFGAVWCLSLRFLMELWGFGEIYEGWFRAVLRRVTGSQDGPRFALGSQAKPWIIRPVRMPQLSPRYLLPGK